MNSNHSIDCICGSSEDNSPSLIKCPICNNSQHRKCIPSILLKADKYLCMKCLFKYSDPFISTLKLLLPPTVLEGKKEKFNFGTTITSNSVILIRCMICNENSNYEMRWPAGSSIFINDRPIIKALNNKDNDEPIVFVHNPSMIEKVPFTNNVYVFNQYIHEFSSRMNELEVKFSHSMPKDKLYIIQVEQAILLDSLEKVSKEIESVYQKDRMFELLNNNSVESERIHATDIYHDSEPIKVPARGYLCNHLSVFDLNKFLSSNKNIINKRCPICKKLMVKLYIDKFIKYKMDEDKLKKNTNYYIKGDYSKIEGYNDNVEEKGSHIDEEENNLKNQEIKDCMEIDEEPIKENLKNEEDKKEDIKMIPQKDIIINDTCNIVPRKKTKKEREEEKQRKINQLFNILLPQMKHVSFFNDYMNKDN